MLTELQCFIMKSQLILNSNCHDKNTHTHIDTEDSETLQAFEVGGSNGAISSWAKFKRHMGENNARGVSRLVTI